MRIPDMPFKILVLAPFAMNLGQPWKAPPLGVDLHDMDAVMDALGISGYFPLPADLCPAGGIELRISRLKDFHPDALVQGHPFLKQLVAAAEAEPPPAAKARTEARTEAEPRAEAADRLDSILNMVAMPGQDEKSAARDSARHAAGARQVDTPLQAVLAEIYADPAFRATESAWRGLKCLLQQGQGRKTGPGFHLEIVPVTRDTLEETLGALTISQVNDLPSLVLVDLPFDSTPRSVGLLEKVAQFAEILMAPAVAWASPGLVGLDSWADLPHLPFLPHHLDSPNFGKLNQLKSQPEADWLAVACNRFLLRYPYGKENPPRRIVFEEPGNPWVSPVWAVGALILASFTGTGWPTRFTDWQAFQLKDLPLHRVDSQTAIPAEVLISEDRLDQFRRAGIMALAAAANKDAAFIPMETAFGGTSLAYQLFAARMVQFLLWCKDHLPLESSGEAGAEVSGRDLEEGLRRAVAAFWEKSGHPVPQEFRITAGPPVAENRNADKRIPLRVEVTPSRRILPSGEGLTLEINW